jgi:serine/threonine-protein kinase
MGFQLVVYPDYAITESVSPKNSHVEQDFMYRDGQWNSWGADTTTSSFAVLADLSAFNAPRWPPRWPVRPRPSVRLTAARPT